MRCCCWSHLVGLVAELTAERFVAPVGGLVFFQQGGAAEHLVTGGALVELLRVDLLDVLLMLLQRGEAQTTALTVVRLRHIWSSTGTSSRQLINALINTQINIRHTD